MKERLVFRLRMLLVLWTFTLGIVNVSAATYYVSSSGNDGNSGLSTGQAWRTLNKVNSVSFRPGDQILFQRGASFSGSLSLRSSGQAGNPIYIGAYGSGASPVITGFRRVTGWVNRGGNIWESNTSVSSLSSINVVSINGVNTPMGRYPDNGYISIDSHVSHSSLTSNGISGSPNWTGAELVAKKNRWILDRTRITAHSGNTIFTAVPVTGYDYINNKGFFIQNDIRTLTQPNEWYFNPTSKRISVFSYSQPSAVDVSTTDVLLDLLYVSYITIADLDIKGANEFAIQMRTCKYITIENCTIEFIGDTGIKGLDYSNGQPSASTGCIIQNNTFDQINNNAIRLSREFGNILITQNTIENTATLPGMGGSGDGTYSAIGTYADNTTVSYNTIKNTGYLPVAFNGDNIYIYRNLIDTYCYIKDDGGGVYCASPGEGRRVVENIILNGLGSPEGNSPAVNPWDIKGAVEGIYLDNGSGAVTVQGNTIYNVENQGFLVHGNSGGNTIQNNTFFNCRGYNGMVNIQSSSSTVPQRNNVFKGNKVIAAQAGQVTLKLQSTANDLNLFGDFNNNYYGNPLGDNQIMSWKDASQSSSRKGDLAAFRAYTRLEANSTQFNQKVARLSDIRFEYNATASEKTLALSVPMIDITGKKYAGSVTLQPFESVVLFVDGNPAAATANFTVSATSVLVNQSVQFTNTSTSATSYRWSFGDGQTSTSTSPSYSYTRAGTFTVTLTAYSSGGNSTRSVNITVTNPVTSPPTTPTEPTEPTSPTTPPAGGTIGLSEDFSDGNFNGWTIVDDGSGGGSSSWTVQDGSLLQSANIYGGSATDDGRIGTFAYWNNTEAMSWSNYNFQLDMASNDDDGIGVMFYYTNANNYYRFEVDRQRGFRKLIKKVNGEVTLLAEDNGSYTQGRTYPILISVADGSIVVSMDGTTLFGGAVSDNALTQGTVALYSWANAGSFYDNIEVALHSVDSGGSDLTCTLFQHGAYAGQEEVLTVGMHNNLDFNDAASSIEVAAGLRVTLYENINGGGGKIVFTETTDAFWNLTFDNGARLNDNVSSVLVEDLTTPTPGLGEVVLFINGGYAGNTESLELGMHNQLVYDNAASSIEIPDGVRVTLFENTNGGGGKIVLNQTTDRFWNLTFDNGVSLNDNVSSVLVEDASQVINAVVSLFTNGGYAGSEEQFELGLFNVDYNDAASSIEIPDGLQVTLYENINGGGGKIVFTETTDRFWNYTFDNGRPLNDNVSSLLVEYSSSLLKSGKIKGGASIEVEQQTSDVTEMRVWPNPAIDRINIEFPSADNRTLTLYNMAGGVVYNQQISGLFETVSIADLKQGLYILQVVNTESNEVFRNQIVKQ